MERLPYVYGMYEGDLPKPGIFHNPGARYLCEYCQARTGRFIVTSWRPYAAVVSCQPDHDEAVFVLNRLEGL